MRYFHILTVGFKLDLIDRLWNGVKSATGFTFSHICHPSLDQYDCVNGDERSNQLYYLRDTLGMKIPPPDRGMLAELARPGVPTIHNMIMGDRVVRTLDYTEALSYATCLTHRMEGLFQDIKPSVIIGDYDALHGGIALAVARKLRIPWFALTFTTIPKGLSGFCTGMTPDTIYPVRSYPPEELYALADNTLREFELQQLAVPAYESANTMGMILRRLPAHMNFFYGAVARAIRMRFDKFTQYPARRLAKEYLRKRRNILLLPKHWFIDCPPPLPYLLIGLHRQPESSIDVWASFFSDQFHVIEAISRATPPTHLIAVKLHKSDADNYSRNQLERLRRLPGVRLVSPFVQSRGFIENASLVLAIQGNIALEAAMLGRPVLVFGDTKFVDLPSVSRVNRITDLPDQLRTKLAEKKPEREEIVRGLMSYLGRFAPGCYNNWEVTPSEVEFENLAELFRALRDYVDEYTAVQNGTDFPFR